MSKASDRSLARGIAIVGMAGRFPGADDPEAFWRNLRSGVESIRRFSRRELEEAGVERRWLDDPRYVPLSGALDDIELFDADFFGFSPRDAEILDPQHRLFLEVCWQALEHAGHDAATFDGAIGVFGGCGASDYLFHNLLSHPELLATAGPLQLRLYNSPDFLTSLVAYKLGLTGPSVTVQSACSTALVAVCLACQSLLSQQCDAALAGGVSLAVPARSGYLATESVMSPDGRCRAFDAAARGTVSGAGGGVVVLRRLADALADGDQVLAVIRGFATNNDGAYKSSYTAPSVDGQMEVVAMAQAMAGISPDSITYVEAHGTGTPLGDPIEVAALSEAFALGTARRSFCGLGSVKTQIGHLDAAAGIAGLIKTVQALRHGWLPPSLHYERPNPQIDFAASPFQVVTAGRPWEPRAATARRAGVSAFGLGGVNAHVVIEEAPASTEAVEEPPRLLLVLSAATESARETLTERLAEHLESHPDEPLADVAYTGQVGRRMLPFRRALVCRDRDQALTVLSGRDPRRLLDAAGPVEEKPLAFLFPGLGHHYEGMAAELYRQLPAFREPFDRCAAVLAPLLGCDPRQLLLAAPSSPAGRDGLDLRRLVGRGAAPSPVLATRLSQPLVFAVELALAQLLLELGLVPQAMLGFSIGEYVAACLAGVLSWDDALTLVARRAQLIAELPPGAMLAVPFAEEHTQELLAPGVSLAAVNGPEASVVAGEVAAIVELEARLQADGVACRRLATEHAFHSPLMEPIIPAFHELVASLTLSPPELPYLSNVSGDWIRAEEATDPDYWVEHLCRPVRFGDGVGELWREGGRVLVEVGPGQTLCSWALQHPAAAELSAPLALPTLRHDYDRQHDLGFLLHSLGRLWLAGQPIAWPALWREQSRRRVALPTYPFERRRYWVDPPTAVAAPSPIVDREASTSVLATEAHQADVVGPTPLPVAPRMAADAYPRPALAVPYVAPRSAFEKRLVSVFREVLRLEQVGILDSFFDLGGDSLQATSLLGRVRQTFGKDISLRAMFESPTVVDLAALLRGSLGETSTQPEPAALEPAIDERLPPVEPLTRPLDPSGQVLSFAQKRLWFLAELEPDHPGYNHPLVFELCGSLDVGAWTAALAEMVRRHEILRTAFLRPSGAAEPVQRVAAKVEVELAEVDLSALDEEARERELRRGVRYESRRPFVLARGALFRPRLFRLETRPVERQVALLLLHHIVADGWSMGILAREIEALYRAAALGHPSPLPALPFQYVDFAIWQHRWLSVEVLAEQLTYWRRQLADSPTLELPADRPRSARQAAGVRRRFFVDRPAVEALAELARGHEATLFMAVLAGFQTWLFRLTGETDLTLGTPVAGRRHPGSEALIGFFVNTLVLRSRLRPRSSFREQLETARKTTLAAHAHQDLPFERLVEELQPRRELDRTPFFQVMLAWQSAPEARLELPGLELRPLELWPEAALFELTLSPVRERDGCLFGYFETDGTFDAATAERMTRQVARLLTAIAADPDRPVAELPLLAAAELQQLTVEPRRDVWSFLEVVHRLVGRQAAERPGAVALAWGDGEQVSHGELDRRARHLAAELVDLGVGLEVRVGLCCERSAGQIIALLAVLRAGGCVVPVDPSYPLERRRFMIADAGLALLLVSATLGEQVGEEASSCRVIAFGARESGGTVHGGTVSDEIYRSKYSDGTSAVQVNHSKHSGGTFSELDALAYVLYTSGSTGRPKGVAVSHRVLANLVAWQLTDLSRPRRTLQLAPLSFDVSLQEILTTLAGGGQLTLVDEDARRDPQALWRLLETARIERLFLPFVALQQLAEMHGEAADRSGLVELVTAGEALHASAVVRALCRWLGARLDNHYGPTESHVATAFRLPVDPETWEALPAIGRPIAGGEALVLDRELRPRPLGAVGELFLGGAILARGYLDRPAETATRFVPHPLSPHRGRRLYRTGDLARWSGDGQLHFLGRADAQVKVRGFRIEPGEIEAALLAVDGVASAAVARRGEAATARLVAFAVPRATASLSAEGLRAALGERLPEYLVPTSVIVTDSLPLLPSGKVDRRALSRIALPATGPARSAAATRHDEEVVAGLFATLLEVVGVGPDDDFFALGGHSLLATRLSSRLREVFGVELGVRAVFEAPTPAALAARLLAARQVAAGHLARPPLHRQKRPEVLPLSFAQERLWFIEQLQGPSPLYNMPMVLRLAGHLDGAFLSEVLREIGERHETLRTTFVTDAAGRPRQVIRESSRLMLRRVDLRALPSAVRLAEARRLARAEALLPFDLARGSLWRAVMVIVAPREHVLFLTLHHIISDGWSLGVLVREVAALYAAKLQGAPSPLAPLTVGYGDYTQWQHGWLRDEWLAQELGWWRRQLVDLPPSLTLPTDRPRPAERGWHGSSVTLHLSADLMVGLNRLGREQGATLFMTLMAGFKALLWRSTGEEDIAVGTPIAGRKDVALEGLIGFFVNTLVLRDRLSRPLSFAELVLAVRQTALDAYAHQDVPFEKLVEELRPPRHLGQAPLFQVMLVLQNAPIPSLELPGLALRPFDLDAVSAKFDLTLSLEEQENPGGDGGLRGWLMYASELFDRTTIGRFRDHFVTLLSRVVAEPRARLGELDAWRAAERHQVLVEEAGPPGTTRGSVRLEVLLADQVAHHRDRLAVVAADGVLSYGVLAGRAADLARLLESRGARPEVGVGIGLEPGLELAVAVLAVARTGAFSVPLDPSYPASRLDFMLADSGAVLIVADAAADGPLGDAARRRGVLLCAPRGAAPEPSTDVGWTAVDAQHPLYVIYTSGSTGQPKGVALPRRAFVNLLAWHHASRLIGVRTAQFAPLSFDASYHEIFATWTTGGTLEPVPSALRRDVDGLARFLAHERVEKITLPGLVLHQLAARENASSPWRSSLREVITSGEQLTVTPVLKAWLGGLAERSPCPVPLHNQYGPSESHMVSACTLSGDPATWPARPTLGRPIPNTSLHIVDAALRPLPIGVIGELAIGGVCLARGYVGRPARTASCFAPAPFPGVEPGARIYLSGDLARRLADGHFDFVGRRDHQVKVHGVRLELGEIEACLIAQGEVRAAVAAVRDAGGGRRLVAYAVSAGRPLDPVALRRQLAERLPQAMVPAVIVELESLPRLPNGKIDRAALPAPEAFVAVREAPRGAVEERLADLWRQLLGCDAVGRGDDFFALGGHSLLATQLISRIRQTFGIELEVRALFSDARLAELALKIEGGLSAAPLPPIVAAPRDHPLPASFAQERLWFLDALMPQNPFYNLVSAVELHGRLDQAALARAVQELVCRHEILRTTFAPPVSGEETPRQVISPPGKVPSPVPLVELAALPEAARGQVVEAAIHTVSRQPFDLRRGPLLRFWLLRRAEERHTLVFTLHHIITDGWSLGVMVHELVAFYAAATIGGESSLPPQGLQYADYALWQRSWLEEPGGLAQRAWWRRQLAELPIALELPCDHPRPASPRFRGHTENFHLDAELRQRLEALARQHGATAAMVLLAGFELLLDRLTGQDDFAVGMAIANRRRLELEGLLGLFVNTLAIRRSAGSCLHDRITATRHTCLEAYANQDLPFERLVEELAPRRQLGRNPLVQVMFGYQSFPRPTLEVPGLTLVPPREMGDPGTSKFDLTLSLIEEGDGLQATFEADRDLFDPTTIKRLGARFERLLSAAVAEPERPYVELSWLSAAEGHQLLAEWNSDQHDVAVGELSLERRFAAHATARPEAVAVVGVDTVATFGLLAARTGRLADALHRRGIGPEKVVALHLERSIELVAAILAVWRVGAAYLPLEASHPSARLQWQVSDSQAVIVLTLARLRQALEHAAVEILCLDALDQGAAMAAAIPFEASHLAYVIYTSGSTGRPKGVACTHRGLLNLLADVASRQPLLTDDAASFWTSPTFDVSLYELGIALRSGAILHIVPETLRGDGAGFVSWLAERRVTCAYVAPFLLAELERRVGAGRHGLVLRHLLVGVEPIPESRLVAIAEGLPELEILNGYGPAEATVCATFYPVPRHPASVGRAPLGRALRGVAIQVLDGRLEPLPSPQIGELCVAGIGLARAYLGRPGLTAERFVPDPHAASPGERLYRTGDLARWRADGQLEFFGRRDHQVKLYGLRIELGELEAVLGEHEAVGEAVALVRGEQLVAFFIAERGQTVVDPYDLRGFLSERLPRAMVPAVIHQLDAWPLTAHGKLDRAALHEVALPSSAGNCPPTSRAERALAAIWAEVLRRDVLTLSADDDFFSLGGHSLLAAQVVARIRDVWGVELPLRVLFEEPVLAGLATRLGTARGASGAFKVAVLPRPESDRALVLPLSFAQERLWFIDQLQPASAAYNLPLAVSLEGRLRPAVLSAAFSALVARHETLRTTFVRLDANAAVDREVWLGEVGRGKPGQRIAPPSPSPLPMIDLRSLSLAARRRESDRLARDDARRPFVLDRGPLLRLSLVGLDEERALLLLNLHHIVGDAWSMKVLLEELGILYRAGEAAKTAVLPRLAVQYADYAAWQRRWLDGERLDGELAFWRDELRGAVELELAGDRPRPTLRSGSGSSLLFTLDEELTARLEALARAHGATLFMVLLAAFEILLGRYSQQRDFTVGTPVAGRRLASAEALIGFFVNTLVLRSDLAARPPSFAALLARVRDRALAVLAHQELPFERLVEALQPRRDPGRTPLFNVLLALQNVPLEPLELDDLRLEVLGVEGGVARFDLSWALTPTPRGLDGRVTYNRDLFDATSVERLHRHFAALLSALVDDATAELAALPLFTVHERHQLLIEWNDTAVVDEPALLHRLFAARVRQNPEAVALIAERDPARADGDAGFLSYGALHGRAVRLAGELRRRGVGPDVLVAVAAQPSLAMVVGFFAILEAGGAYLPLEPTLPAARLAFILGDALRGRQPSLLLADDAFLTTWSQLTWDAVEPAMAEAVASLEVLPLARDSPSVTDGEWGGVVPENLAYVIYTSGSTGRPKGVMCTHHGLVNRMRAEDPLKAEDCMLQRSSSIFDASLRELFWPLLRGAKVYLASFAARRDPAMLLTLMDRQRVSVAGFVPTLLARVLREPEQGRLRALRQLISAGEAISVDVAREVRQLWSWVQLDNRYGPTETSIVVTGHRVDRVDHTVPIGRPQRNSRVHLLDRALDLVPIGVIGELCTCGIQLTRGYLDRPGLTATIFVADPFAAESGARLYRSGDLARRLADGAIDFVGRRDHQVKIRGFRIEPGEIETVLCRHPAIEAALVHLDVSAGDRRLVAYLVAPGVATSGAALDTVELRRFLALRLPDYMVPGVYVALERLPALPNGKVDRKALHDLGDAGRLGSGQGFAAPQSELERTLAAIWAEVLGLERVGLDDGFFDLGGHSLQLVEVRSRIEEVLARSFPLSELFNHATVASLARFLSAADPAATSTAVAEVEARQDQLGAGKDRRRDRLARRRRVTAEIEGGER